MIRQLLTCEGPKGKVTHSEYEVTVFEGVSYSMIIWDVLGSEVAQLLVLWVSNGFIGCALRWVEEA
jgi:hypothetical protein